MEINCPNCGKRLDAVSNEPLRFVNRESNGTDPPSFLIVESGAAGDWLLHSCDATTPDRGAPRE